MVRGGLRVNDPGLGGRGRHWVWAGGHVERGRISGLKLIQSFSLPRAIEGLGWFVPPP